MASVQRHCRLPYVSKNGLRRVIFLVLLMQLGYLANASQEVVYRNEFAIEVQPGPNADRVADEIASQHGYENARKIMDGHYLLVKHSISKRSTEHAHQHHTQLKQDPRVLWVEQQHEKKRVKRSSSDRTRYTIPATDPLFKDQWYLNKGGNGGYDMNVAKVWSMGYTGRGIVVTILDDGIQPNHPDLADNYDPQASYDINDNDPDPTPQDNHDNKHGTRCAGEVAAIAFNEFCGVGIAFNSSIGGVRMLDGTVTDEVEARALSLNPNHVDIYSASWGPEDDGKTVDGPGRLAKRAFIDGIRRGRHGKGSIYVWASGNGGKRDDNCNCDGYTNSVYTLSISSATQSGRKPWYLEECSSTLASTYSSGSPGSDGNVVTVDMDTSYFKSLKAYREPVTKNLCTESHTGTSASAPIAAGMAALALEANPNLTWRDMQYLVMLTSRYEPLKDEPGWATNAIGRKFSHKFGYGLMDAEKMVKAAEKWKGLPDQRICETEMQFSKKVIPASRGSEITSTINTTGCAGKNDEIRFMEHVQAKITLKFSPLGNMQITLISPSGTTSHLLFPRPRDVIESSVNNWPFLSVHFWGERPTGTWKLIVKNAGTQYVRYNHPGELLSWSLVFMGTYEDPVKSSSHRNIPRSSSEQNVSSSIRCLREQKVRARADDKCLDACPDGEFALQAGDICVPCHGNCRSCFGPLSDHCTSCDSRRYFFNDMCLEQCPSGTYASSSLRECLPCKLMFGCKTCSRNGTCSECQDAFELDSSGRCVYVDQLTTRCDAPCSSCAYDDESICIACSEGFKLAGEQCVSKCPSNQFERDGRCIACHGSCNGCSGPSHRNCTACDSDMTLTNGVCHRCLVGQFLSQDSLHCEPCHGSCSACNGRSSRDCIGCKSPLFIQGYQCLPCCTANEEHRVNSLKKKEAGCCRCETMDGPCVSQDHPRSIQEERRPPVSVRGREPLKAESILYSPLGFVMVVGLLAASVFLVAFVSLERSSRRSSIIGSRRDGKHSYTALMNPGRGRFVGVSKKFDEEEEDMLFEKL